MYVQTQENTLVILSAREINKSVQNTDSHSKEHTAAYRQYVDGNSPIMKSYAYLITTCNTVLLEKLTGSQLVK